MNGAGGLREAVAIGGHPGVIWPAQELPWYLSLTSWTSLPDGRLLMTIQNTNSILDAYTVNFAVFDPDTATLDAGEIVCRLWEHSSGRLYAGEGWALTDGSETVPFTLD